MGILEFESISVVILMLIDMLLGSINHIFIKKDNVSSIALKSIGRKAAIAIIVLSVVLFSHLNDRHIFNGSVQPILQTYGVVAVTMIALVLYYELTSVLKHIHIMTGIDFTIIPGVKSELESLKKGLTNHDKY